MPRRHQIAQTLGIALPAAVSADPRPWHAVVMSRLGRSLLARRVELATLYRWTEQALARGDAPLSVAGTAAHCWVKRACELLATTAVELALDDDPSVNQRALQSGSETGTSGETGTHTNRVSQTVLADGRSLGRDALAILLADRVDVPWVRPGGTIHQLLLARLAEQRSPSVRVLIPVPMWGQGQRSDFGRVIQELIAAGAVGYCCRWGSAGERFIEDTEPACEAFAGTESDDWSKVASLIKQPQRWLIHCTRGRQGAWPGQSDQQFRDWLLLSRPQASDLSPLATLQRIVDQRQLVGSGRTVRGGKAVVCFSALPLLDVASHRVFRPHLGRWDAEPYGLAIDFDAAKRLGAQPVIYTDPDTKPPVLPAPVWRLQSRGRTFDWTAEQEWRLPGTADLRGLGPKEAIVFVDRDEEIARLRASSWPVISLESLRRIASEGVAKCQHLG